jgi:hypothetical protein
MPAINFTSQTIVYIEYKERTCIALVFICSLWSRGRWDFILKFIDENSQLFSFWIMFRNIICRKNTATRSKLGISMLYQ